MRYRQLISCGLLVAFATFLGTTSVLAQKSSTKCDQLTKELQILEDKRKTYETQRDAPQKRIDDDRRNGRPVHQADLDAVKDAKERIERVDESIKQAQERADPSCRKEEICAPLKMVWCANQHSCVDPSYNTCEHCGCGVTR